MNESGRIFYKGLPQDDISKANTSHPRILSDGSKMPQNERGKDKVTSPTIIFLLIIIAMCVGLGIVFGIRYLKLASEISLTANKNADGVIEPNGVNMTKFGIADNEKQINHNGNKTKVPTGVENPNKETSAPKTKQDNDMGGTLVPPEETKSVKKELNITTPLPPQPKPANNPEGSQSTVTPKTSTTPTKIPNPESSSVGTTPIPSPTVKTTESAVQTTVQDKPQVTSTTTTEKPSTTTTTPEGKIAQGGEQENKTQKPGPVDEDDATEVNDSTTPAKNVSVENKEHEKNKQTKNDKKPKSTKNKEDDSEKNPAPGNKPTTPDTIVVSPVQTIKNKKNKLREVFETLLANPSVQLLLGATVVIMIGLSLIITALVCHFSKPKKIRRRRQGKAGQEIDNENVILLTEDASEDEFVQA